MLGQSLRDLQATLNRKADAIQREFVELSESVQAISRRLAELPSSDQAAAVAEQAALRERQHALADEANEWRDKARAALRQPGDDALQAYLDRLVASGDEAIVAAAARARHLLTAPEAELEQMSQARAREVPTTPAARLIERARTEYDLRGPYPGPRQQSAVQFANRPGLAQDEAVTAELQAALSDSDPMVQDMASLTLIQIYRFRATRLGDLDAAHSAVVWLAAFKHRGAIPVLIEIAETPRTGYASQQGAMITTTNLASREAALKALAMWHTSEARTAVRARVNDRDPQVAKAAARVLDENPGEWGGKRKDEL
jgi:hypothetical protein